MIFRLTDLIARHQQLRVGRPLSGARDGTSEEEEGSERAGGRDSTATRRCLHPRRRLHGAARRVLWRDLAQKHSSPEIKEAATIKLERFLTAQRDGTLKRSMPHFPFIVLCQLAADPPSDKVGQLVSEIAGRSLEQMAQMWR